MLDTTIYIKITGVPSEIPGISPEDDDNHLPCQEFEGLVFPTITPNGEQRGSYIVPFLEAWPHINIHRPILAEWLRQRVPRDERASTRLVFETEICKKVSKDEPVLNFF